MSEKDVVERERESRRRKGVHGEGWGQSGACRNEEGSHKEMEFCWATARIELQLGDLWELKVDSLVLARPQVKRR